MSSSSREASILNSNSKLKLVTLNKGFQLAESWVGNMSGSAVDESNEVAFEGRQPRLGLGAKAVSQSIAGNSADPLERRIVAKINAQRKRAARSMEDSTNSSNKNDGLEKEEEDSDDDSESRAKAFTKKRVGALNPLQASKKKK